MKKKKCELILIASYRLSGSILRMPRSVKVPKPIEKTGCHWELRKEWYAMFLRIAHHSNRKVTVIDLLVTGT